MKFSTVLAVFAVSVAVATTGCRYDKAGDADASALPGEGADIDANGLSDLDSIEGEDIDDASQTGSLADIEDGARFEDIYTRCTDVNFEPVYFGFDSTVIPQAELDKVDAVAQHLLDNADRVVVVEGHCDDRGSNEYNLSLGDSRASIVRSYLVQNGVTADRIQTRSYGEERPAVEGAGESVWAKNRRGEFAIFRK